MLASQWHLMRMMCSRLGCTGLAYPGFALRRSGRGRRSRGGNYNRSGCDPPPSYLSKLAVGVLAARPGGGSQGGGGGRTTHYYHTHTPRGHVCLGAWGYRGMYAIIAISRKKVLRVLRTKGIVTPSTKDGTWRHWRHGPHTAIFQNSGGGGCWGGRVAYKDRARPPPPPRVGGAAPPAGSSVPVSLAGLGSGGGGGMPIRVGCIPRR